MNTICELMFSEGLVSVSSTPVRYVPLILSRRLFLIRNILHFFGTPHFPRWLFPGPCQTDTPSKGAKTNFNPYGWNSMANAGKFYNSTQ